MRLPALATVAMLAAEPAMALRTINGMEVRGTGPDTFSVIFDVSYGDSQYWCAAGDYAVRIGLPSTTRIYRTSPPPRKRGQGIDFSTDPAKAVDPGISIFGSPDKGMSAGGARTLCTPGPRNLR